jgi:hypothetical protein
VYLSGRAQDVSALAFHYLFGHKAYYTPINSSFYTLCQCDVTYVAHISDFHDKNTSDVHLSFGFSLPFRS